MRRVLLAGAGALGTVVVAEAVRRARSGTGARHAAPATPDVAPSVPDRSTSTVEAVLGRFRSAMAEREDELVRRLLVTPEGGDAGAVFRRRPAAPEAWEDDLATADLPRPRGAHAADGPRSEPAGRVDDDEPLYDF